MCGRPALLEELRPMSKRAVLPKPITVCERGRGSFNVIAKAFVDLENADLPSSGQCEARATYSRRPALSRDP